jgi:tubulin alpha
MIKLDPGNGKYMACSLHYGGDIVPKDTFDALVSLKSKRTINFVDWCPTGFKVSINRPYNLPQQSNISQQKRSCFLLSNNSCISKVFNTVA